MASPQKVILYWEEERATSQSSLQDVTVIQSSMMMKYEEMKYLARLRVRKKCRFYSELNYVPGSPDAAKSSHMATMCALTFRSAAVLSGFGSGPMGKR